VSQIAIYVEGGGDSTAQKSALRQGFDALLEPQKNAARKKRIRWKLVCCGSRNEAHDAFVHACAVEPGAFNVLLVDSEGPLSELAPTVPVSRRDYLMGRECGWRIGTAEPERIHLMVQCMEAWILSDQRAVVAYYGQGCNQNALPRRNDLEQEPKASLHGSLVNATRATQKGEYKKIKHGSELLGMLAPEAVAARCRHFGIFAGSLDAFISTN
jgi:hypothetical protein